MGFREASCTSVCGLEDMIGFLIWVVGGVFAITIAAMAVLLMCGVLYVLISKGAKVLGIDV